ncbi:calpastatin isoform X3 [Latimeria chalumnae]|uniref:calpastatin isoform X3 n=1 Tax=Latimeria chalumnae TaxID=7897 RepID=UPI00313CAD82
MPHKGKKRSHSHKKGQANVRVKVARYFKNGEERSHVDSERTHPSEKQSGTKDVGASKPGDSKGEEKQATAVKQPLGTQPKPVAGAAGGAAAATKAAAAVGGAAAAGTAAASTSKTQPKLPSPTASNPPSMKRREAKGAQATVTESAKTAQSDKTKDASPALPATKQTGTAGVKAAATQQGKPSQGKPEVPKAGKPGDALDELMGTLDTPVLPESPKFRGPEIKEKDHTSKEAVKVGEREDTIPPEYRLGRQEGKGGNKIPPLMTDKDKSKEKCKDPKDDTRALDFLSEGFQPTSAGAPLQSTIPPPKSAGAPLQSTIPPPKSAGVPLQSAAASVVQPAAPPSQKASKPGKALDELMDTLDTPVLPESPKFQGPEIKEKDHTSKEAVKVGEREDTIPPEYRLGIEEGKDGNKIPPLVTDKDKSKEKCKDPKDDKRALDFLSEGFQPTPAGPPLQSTIPPLQSAAAPVMQSSASTMKSAAPPSQKVGKPGDALDQLMGTLNIPVLPESPKFHGPEIKEKDHTSKEAVKVGEREDTIPPEYRLGIEEGKDGNQIPPLVTDEDKSKEKCKDPKDDKRALDFLSEGFQPTPAGAPLQSTIPPPKSAGAPLQSTIPPPKSAGAPLQSAAVPVVQPAAPPSQKASKPGKALDELMDTLDTPILPESPKFQGPEIKEKDHTSKEAVKVGEREDTIPPEYRLGREEGKDGNKIPPLVMDMDKDKLKEKCKDPKDDKRALDFLSEGFQPTPAGPPLQSTIPPLQSAAAPVMQSSASTMKSAAPPSQKTGKPGDALDQLMGTLNIPVLPESPKFHGPEIKEKDHTSKEAVKVGEREDTIPPEYRLGIEEGKDGNEIPPLVTDKDKSKEKCKDPKDDRALDFLSEGFQPTPAGAPLQSTIPPPKSAGAPLQSTIPPPKSAGAPLQSAAVPVVQPAAPPSQKASKPGKALDELMDTLDTPVLPESPKFQGPEIKEKDHTSKEAVKVGEREDTIPPEYRLGIEEGKDGNEIPPLVTDKDKSKEKCKDPKDDKRALDILSEGFQPIPAGAQLQSTVPPPKSAGAQLQSTVPPPKSAGDLLQSAAAPVVQSAAPPSQKAGKPGDALDELMGTLDTPVLPESPKFLGPEIKEKDHTSKEAVRVGERGDTIPPEYRLGREEGKDGNKIPPLTDECKLKEPSKADKGAGGSSTASGTPKPTSSTAPKATPKANEQSTTPKQPKS